MNRPKDKKAKREFNIVMSGQFGTLAIFLLLLEIFYGIGKKQEHYDDTIMIIVILVTVWMMMV